jgi:hypothetical protein
VPTSTIAAAPVRPSETGAARGYAELDRPWIRRVGVALDQPVALKRAGQLRDEHRLEAGVVGQLALAGAPASPPEPVEGGQQRVLRVRQAEELRPRRDSA